MAVAVGGFKFMLYAKDGEDLGTRAFSEPNWKPGDVVALADQVYRVQNAVYLDDDDVRGMPMLEEPSPGAAE